jgi:hypothetical protein
MSRTATHADEAGLARDPNAPKSDEILSQLRAILASPAFHGSKRCQQFLDFVCEKSLAGDAGSLKERAIAIEVFGRRPDSGLGEDTIVRVGAREVRKRLAQYYVTPEGASASILIELPSGSYAPEFRYAAAVRNISHPADVVQVVIGSVPAVDPSLPLAEEAAPAIEPPRESPANDGPATKLPTRGVAFVLAGLAVVVVAVFMFSRWSADPRERAFQKFWAPVMQSGDSMIIGVGHPIVYQPSHRAALLNAKRLSAPPFGTQIRIELAPKELDGSDMIAIMNQYVGFGDMVAANEVSLMLARRSHPVRVMLASSVPFADLRQSQAYLIGSFSNRWTMELGQNWRFQFRWTPDLTPTLVDTQKGHERVWTTPAKDDGSTPEDYSLIARIRNSPTGGLLIVSAGIKQFGTEAAGRLLADPLDLGTILNKLPAGWEDENVEIVLHNRVLGNTAAQPEVVASYVW